MPIFKVLFFSGPILDIQNISNKPEESPFGDYTQRLISALLEDDTMGPPDESLERGKKSNFHKLLNYNLFVNLSMMILNTKRFFR